MKTSQVLIVCAWINDDKTAGAHYFAVEKIGSNKYGTYNFSNYDTECDDSIKKIDKSLTGGDLIVAYIVG